MSVNTEEMISRPKELIIIREKGKRYEYFKKLKAALISELDFQLDLASRAFRELEKNIEENDELKTWYSAHMFLFTSRCIWDLLEKIKKLLEEHSDYIESEDLKSLSKIFPYLEFRNSDANENHAEELERWVLDPENDRIIENHIYRKKSGIAIDVKQVLRHFDPETYEMTFKDKTYDLKEQHEEIQEIKQYVEDIYKENFWSL